MEEDATLRPIVTVITLTDITVLDSPLGVKVPTPYSTPGASVIATTSATSSIVLSLVTVHQLNK